MPQIRRDPPRRRSPKVSRVLLAPLLPVIEQDLGIGHGEAGSLFLYLACGSSVGLAASGFVSSRLTHRITITLSIFMAGISMLAISRSSSISLMRGGLVIVGVFAGSYLPSAISTLTGVASQQHWGRALAIHELGPNMGFVTVPLVAEALLQFFSWRDSLAVVAAASMSMGILFLFFGKGGRHKGEPPRFRLMTRDREKPFLLGHDLSLYGFHRCERWPLHHAAPFPGERTRHEPAVGQHRHRALPGVSGWSSFFFPDGSRKGSAREAP